MTGKIFIAFLIAYALGDINPAIILGKLKGIDIRKEGSGNAGHFHQFPSLEDQIIVADLKQVAALLVAVVGLDFLNGFQLQTSLFAQVFVLFDIFFYSVSGNENFFQLGLEGGVKEHRSGCNAGRYGITGINHTSLPPALFLFILYRQTPVFGGVES